MIAIGVTLNDIIEIKNCGKHDFAVVGRVIYA